MRRLQFLAFALVALLAAVGTVGAQTRTYTATLVPGEEVPPNASTATGQATFQLSADGQSLTYRITVNNIQNVTAAHIHIGARGENGPVVLPLFGPSPAGGGARSGVLSEGTAQASNLSGQLAGQALSALVAQMDAGRAGASSALADSATGVICRPTADPVAPVPSPIRVDATALVPGCQLRPQLRGCAPPATTAGSTWMAGVGGTTRARAPGPE